MPRGSRKLKDNISLNIEPVELRRGRNSQLIAARNNRLLDRYYYFKYLRKYKYEQYLEILIYEFNISDATISRIIDRNLDTVIEMTKKKPYVASFRKKWDWLRW